MVRDTTKTLPVVEDPDLIGEGEGTRLPFEWFHKRY
jgi:hypothetical protein